MLKILSWRILLSTFFVVSLFFILSCSTKNDIITSQNDIINSQWNWGEILVSSQQLHFDIPERFIQDDIFLTCASQSIDSCMQEVTFSSRAFDSISCDEFLSEVNRKSCHYIEVTTQAQINRDTSLCSNLDNWLRERCEIEVRLALAVDGGDTSICENFSDTDRIDCNNRIVLNEASLSLDIELCNNMIVFQEEIEMCRDNVLSRMNYEISQ